MIPHSVKFKQNPCVGSSYQIPHGPNHQQQLHKASFNLFPARHSSRPCALQSATGVTTHGCNLLAPEEGGKSIPKDAVPRVRCKSWHLGAASWAGRARSSLEPYGLKLSKFWAQYYPAHGAGWGVWWGPSFPSGLDDTSGWITLNPTQQPGILHFLGLRLFLILNCLS